MQSDLIRFIVNPIAGFRRDKRAIIELIKHRIQPFRAEIVMTSGRGEATRLAREASRDGYWAAVAVGGDGTVNEVATGLVGTDTALGIIPRGSGNGLARGLGLPMDPAGALEIIRTGEVRNIDVGRSAHRYFFAITGVGFDATVGQKFNAAPWRGPFPYFVIAAREFTTYQPEPLKISFDQQQLELAPFLITVANTRQYGNGAVIAPQAQPDDGLLDLCLVPPLKLWRAVVHAPRLFTGTIDRTPVISYRRAREIDIYKSGPILFHVDGEAETCNGNLHISILPHALKVITPMSSTSRKLIAHAN